MSESGTKAVIWRVQMTQPAVRMAFLKAMWKWKELPRRPPRGPLQHSRFSFSWHCENIHPCRYWASVYACLFRLVYLDQCHTPHNVNDIKTRHRTATLDLRPLPGAHQPVRIFNAYWGDIPRINALTPNGILFFLCRSLPTHKHTHTITHNAATRYHSIILSRTVLCGR